MNDGAAGAAPNRPPRPVIRLQRIGVAAAGLTFVAAFCAVLVIAYAARIGPPDFSRAEIVSARVVDRNGLLLRPFTAPDGRWRLPADLDKVDRRFLDMLIAYEDKRFYDHPGVDALALIRAVGQFAVNRRIVSGASTITMQLARLLEPGAKRTLVAKFHEMVRAVQIEQRLTKREILELYLTMAPYGGNLEGVRAAALAYFGKEPRRLSRAEAALLVALPQSPERRRPDRAPIAARAARDRVLDRMVAGGVLAGDTAIAAKAQKVPTGRRPVPMFAPHLAERERARDPDARLHRLTIDRPLQRRLETLAAERAGELGRKISIAILAVENATGKVRAHVGSAGYLDDARAGHIDMTAAIRSPGSALKPFVYGLAFEAGRVHPETLIEDRPAWFGGYAPKNFDEDFMGTVTARLALQMSLNVPAVALLQMIGPERLFSRLRAVGIEPKLPLAEAPGLAVGLGGVGLSLADLTRAYAGIARGGQMLPLTVRAGAPVAKPSDHPVLSAVAAWYVADVLAGAAPPTNAAGGFAYKTGTSYGYRDAWSVGFDGTHTIAVWVGRPDGTPVPGMTGRSAAAPILFDAFARLGGDRTPLKPRPRGAVIATTAELPPPLRRFGAAGARAAGAGSNAAPLGIVFPPDGARVDLGFGAGAAMPLALKASGGEPPLIWLVNGRPVARARFRRESLWQPDGPGFASLSVIDASGASSTVTVRIE